MSSTEEDILLEKMSTKICQLTRVVYLLNNKYLDAQSNIEAIKETYDNELTSIVRQSNDYSTKLQEKIKNLEKLTNIEDDFKKFKDDVEKKYSKEKKEKEDFYNDEIKKLKKENNEKLIEYKTSYEESVRLMKEELENMKKNYLTKFDEIKKNHQKNIKAVNDEKEKLNKTIEELKIKHTNELNNSNTTFAEKIKEKEKKISEMNLEIKRRDDKIKFYTDEVKNLKDLIEKNKISYNELYSKADTY